MARWLLYKIRLNDVNFFNYLFIVMKGTYYDSFEKF